MPVLITAQWREPHAPQRHRITYAGLQPGEGIFSLILRHGAWFDAGIST
jgi:hypothetical protein